MTYVRESSKVARLRNWEAIKSTGKIYTRIYIVFAVISCAIGASGMIMCVASLFFDKVKDQNDWLIGGAGIIVTGCVFGLLTCGPMTVIANLVQSAKELKRSWKGE